MVKAIYSRRLRKGFSMNSRVRYETPGRTPRPKRYKYNNEDEDNSSNTLRDKKKGLICCKPDAFFFFAFVKRTFLNHHKTFILS